MSSQNDGIRHPERNPGVVPGWSEGSLMAPTLNRLSIRRKMEFIKRAEWRKK